MGEYIAAFKAKPKDLLQHGVKGQKWGIRRSSSQLRSAAKARGDAPEKKTGSSDAKKATSPSTPANKPAGDTQDKVESSSDRYARLSAQAKAGKADAMTEQDLKFFNARTEALAKINKMNETQPSWLRETTSRVIQQSAQRQMQTLSDTLVDKYVGDPLKNALKDKTTETVEDAIKRGASETLRKRAIDEGIKKIVDAKKS